MEAEYGNFNTQAVPASVDIMGFSCRHVAASHLAIAYKPIQQYACHLHLSSVHVSKLPFRHVCHAYVYDMHAHPFCLTS